MILLFPLIAPISTGLCLDLPIPFFNQEHEGIQCIQLLLLNECCKINWLVGAHGVKLLEFIAHCFLTLAAKFLEARSYTEMLRHCNPQNLF